MPSTDVVLTTAALLIRNETIANANTAVRVGTMLGDIVASKINVAAIDVDPTMAANSLTALVPQQIVKSALAANLAAGSTLANAFATTADTAVTTAANAYAVTQANAALAASATAATTADNAVTTAANAYANTQSNAALAAANVVSAAGDTLNVAKTSISTDVTMAANSDVLVPSQKAVKAYVAANAGGASTFKEYRATLGQSGSTAPWDVPTENYIFMDGITAGASPSDPLFATVTYGYSSVGAYYVKLTVAIGKTLNVNKVDVAFGDGKVQISGTTQTSDGTYRYATIYFGTKNAAGAFTDGLLNYTNIYIRNYN